MSYHRLRDGENGREFSILFDVVGRGTAWLDTGTHDSLLEAGQFVQVLEHRQGVRIACLEEIALRQGFIDAGQAYKLGESLAKSGYGEYVTSTVYLLSCREPSGM